jgi:hypothetical protein
MPSDPTAPVTERQLRQALTDRVTAPPSLEPNGGKTIHDGVVSGPPIGSAALEAADTGGLHPAAPGPAGTETPAPPEALVATRSVSGRYSGSTEPFRVELRIDVDGTTPTMRVSADYYTINGNTTQYTGSMRVDAASVHVEPVAVTITGVATFTFAVSAPSIRVVIPRVAIDSPPEPAVLEHLNGAGDPTTAFTCAWESDFFRSVMFEQDRQVTVTQLFASYDTGALPSGGAARTLSVVDAYAEAGIQMQTTGVIDVVDTSEAGADQTWSDAELHAAMVNHFSLWKDLPQWAVWLFHAQLHDLGPGLLGIMFDYKGARQRQGSAVFYEGLGGASADKERLQLFCCTHELGHSFNLLHSWAKSGGIPPSPNRPNAYSWMNYPWRYPAGEANFWSNFGFAFDTQELIHLRHGFRDDMIQGGNPFGTGAALQTDEGWNDPAENTSGMTLRLNAADSFAYGEPVAVDLALTTATPTRVPSQLRPRNGSVEIAIKQPAGRTVVYRPLLHQCWHDETIMLDPESPPVVDSAFIHYGTDGFYFDTPGPYRLRARMVAADGSIVVSNMADIRVDPPLSREDVSAADLLFGDEQGTLMYLVGSDFDGLRSGNDAMSELRERYPTHPLAQVARVVQGTNAAREFKTITPNNAVYVRPPDRAEATELLAPVLNVEAAVHAAPARMDMLAMRGLVAERLAAPETHPDEGQIGAYLKARRREIAVELGGSLAEPAAEGEVADPPVRRRMTKTAPEVKIKKAPAKRATKAR